MKRILALLLCTILLAGNLTSCLVEKIDSDTSKTEETTGIDTKDKHTHSYTESTVDADCTKGGYTEFTCSCGHSYKENETDPKGHSYSSKKLENSDTEFTCERCGDVYTEKSPETTAPETTAPVTTAPVTTTPPKKEETPEIADVPGTEMFNGVAFIGDSISLKLQYYHAKTRAAGNATFLCAGSYSANHAVNGTMLLTYQGQNMSPQDALKACGAKKVFILLGMNDIALVGIDKTIENWGVLISRIREKCPGIEIIIQAQTPVYSAGQKGSLNNANVDKYNVALKAFAASNGCGFLDVCTPMKDSSGGLKAEYCSDSFVHFTDAACILWIKLLKDYLS